ncbi:MAG: hydroxylamine reductase [Acidobacteria bacterium]|jgi:hydroxylamine reductase|nr:hydroxylamine reductase [Acidobacteriota bacterium]
MFCFQCQETAANKGCTKMGVCGKHDITANLHDVLIYTLKGISLLSESEKAYDPATGSFITKAMFATITNVNFDDGKIAALIKEALEIRNGLKAKADLDKNAPGWHDSITWEGKNIEEFLQKSPEASVLRTENEDVRSLRELLIYGMKGISAYAHHAAVLGKEKDSIYQFLIEGLASTTRDLSVPEMIDMVMKCGNCAVETMALLDEANTSAYGNPEISQVNIGVRQNPGILISGHDLKDMEELLKQTEGTGVDVYTHNEMLPANYYPAFKKYSHLVGNYGNSWWYQNKEFEAFNGPILMTTNCITPVKDSYKNRMFTTGTAGYPDVTHIPDRKDDQPKDFSSIIELAKKCPAPTELETGHIVGGFAHHQVLALADKVIDAVKSGAIKRFIVMAGCDGRMKNRSYFTEIAENLPPDTVILTGGCAKYRYNKLKLGDIGGIPRVLDAGQCNDSYSLAVVALKLKEIFGLDDINKLPISFDIAWYEQKAVAVFLALLALGVKGIRLGPTLPGFLSPNVANVIVEKFGVTPVGNVQDDIKAMMAGN